MFLVQVVSWLPEALRPGVFVAVVILLLWFIFIRRGLSEVWRATCRGAARAIDLSLGAVLRIEYMITTARRRRGLAPPRWAFASAGVSGTLEACAARLYQRNLQRAQDGAADGSAKDEKAAAEKATGEKSKAKTMLPQRKSPIPWRLCAVIVAVSTAAWITMTQLSEASIVRYRISQAFDPWRDVEEWAGASSDRDTPPTLVRFRRHPALVNARLACESINGCHGWVLLKGRNEAVVAVRYVEMGEGAVLVQLHLTAEQVSKAPVPEIVVTSV
jgi:hypothetical protein